MSFLLEFEINSRLLLFFSPFLLYSWKIEKSGIGVIYCVPSSFQKRAGKKGINSHKSASEICVIIMCLPPFLTELESISSH
jgi:hypothetical protein